MPIRCPTCLSAYDLPPQLVRPGRKLRCADCANSWSLGEDARALQVSAPPTRPELGPEIVAEARSSRRSLPPFAPREPRRRPIQRKPRASGPAKVAVGLGLLGAAMAGIGRKELVVGFYPPSAGVFAAVGLPVNLRGLAIADMHGIVKDEGSRPVLTLKGEIRNLRDHAVPLPPLRIAVRDKAHNELYSWTSPPPRSRLEAGESVAFRTRLAAPPEDGRDVMVSFAGGG